MSAIKEAQKEGLVDYAGQKDFFDPLTSFGSVSVVGAGGIGSPTIMGLSKIGVPNITIYDDDDVEPHNVTAQHYRIADVGKSKVDAIADQARQVSYSKIREYKKVISSNDVLPGNIVISAVDSMKSRKEIFEAAKKSPSVEYLIDGRLGGELIVCITINIRDKDQVEWYLSEDMMFDDSQMESQACTSRAIYDVGLGVSALIVRATRKLLSGKEVERLQMLNMNDLKLTTF